MRRATISLLLIAGLLFASVGLLAGAGNRIQQQSPDSSAAKPQDPAPPQPTPPQEAAPQQQARARPGRKRLQDLGRQESPIDSLFQPPNRPTPAHRAAHGHFQQHPRSPQVRARRTYFISL